MLGVATSPCGAVKQWGATSGLACMPRSLLVRLHLYLHASSRKAGHEARAALRCCRPLPALQVLRSLGPAFDSVPLLSLNSISKGFFGECGRWGAEPAALLGTAPSRGARLPCTTLLVAARATMACSVKRGAAGRLESTAVAIAPCAWRAAATGAALQAARALRPVRVVPAQCSCMHNHSVITA